VEAFPNAFLGVLMPEVELLAAPRFKQGRRSDWLYTQMVMTGRLESALSENLDLPDVVWQFEQFAAVQGDPPPTNSIRMHLIPLDAPERQFVDLCALRALFDLGWDCTLGVTLTADREGRARLRVKDGDHLSSKAAKELVIGLIPVCRQLTQFFELGLWQFNNDVKPNIRMTRSGEIASGVNFSGGHIQGRQFLWCRGDSPCDHERAQRPK
jgi:hypothetical protein